MTSDNDRSMGETVLAPPFTVRELIHRLDTLVRRHPEYGNLPVHVIDMEDEDPSDLEQRKWIGLCTHVEVDAYSEQQGRVMSLMSWPTRRPPDPAQIDGPEGATDA